MSYLVGDREFTFCLKIGCLIIYVGDLFLGEIEEGRVDQRDMFFLWGRQLKRYYIGEFRR